MPPIVAGVPPTPRHPAAGERRPRRASYKAWSESEGELHEDSGLDRRGRGPGHERRRTRRGPEGLLARLGGRGGGGRLRRNPGRTLQPHRQKPARGTPAQGRDLPREWTLQGGQGDPGAGARGGAAEGSGRGGAGGHRWRGERGGGGGEGGGGGGVGVKGGGGAPPRREGAGRGGGRGGGHTRHHRQR